MLRFILRSVVQREPWRVLRQSSGAVEMEAPRGPLQITIESKLQDTLEPSHLEVINESHMHSVPKNSETHFKVVIVSGIFEGKPLLKRHKMVMDTLKEEMEREGGIHALSIHARTPEQWEASGGVVAKSPPCEGGSNETTTTDKNPKRDGIFCGADIETEK